MDTGKVRRVPILRSSVAYGRPGASERGSGDTAITCGESIIGRGGAHRFHRTAFFDERAL